MLKDRAKIYSLKDPTEKLYDYHKAINEAAYKIALENPMIVGNKTELNKLAVAKLDIDGYNYRKKKSRSKQLNPELGAPKRTKIQADFRAKRVKEVSEDLMEVEKQVEFCSKQRDRYTNCKEFSSAIAISEKIEGLQQRKRKLQTELTLPQRQEAKSQKYHSKKVCRSSETCSATVAVESSGNNFVARGNNNRISVLFTSAQEDKTKEAEATTVTIVEDSDDSISEGNNINNSKAKEQQDKTNEAEAITLENNDDSIPEGNFVNDETTTQEENTNEKATAVSTMRDRDGLISATSVEDGKTTVQENNAIEVAKATASSSLGNNSPISFLCQPML